MKFITSDTISVQRMIPYIVSMYFQGQFDGTATNMALPMIEKETNQGVALVQWFSTITTITKASVSIPVANLGILIGVNAAICIASAVIMVCDVSIMFPSELWAYLLIRFVTGLAQSMIMQTSQALVQNLLPQSKRVSFTRQQSLMTTIVSVAGPIIVTQVVDRLGWKWNFFIIACSCALHIVFMLFCVEKVSIQTQKFDIWSSVFLILQLASMCVAFTVLAYYEYAAFGALLAASACLLLAFLYFERKSAHPLINRTLLRQPIIGMALMGSLAFTLVFSEGIIVPQYFNHEFGRMEILGYINAARLLLSFFSQLATHLVLEKWPQKSMLILAICSISTFVLLVLQAVLSFNIYAFSAAYLVKAAVNSPIQMILRPLMLAMVPKSIVHQISSFTSTIQTIMTCVCQTVAGMLLQLCLDAFGEDYRRSMSITYVFFIAMMLVLLGLLLQLRRHWSDVQSQIAQGVVVQESAPPAAVNEEKALLENEQSE